MAERLNSLMKVSEISYSEGSPLLLEAYALYQDTTTGQCIAQLKWKNIDQKPVKAVMIELDGYDAFDQKLEPLQFQYDNLSAVQGSIFGEKTPVLISNTNCVRYDVILKAVSYNEGESWFSTETKPFVKLPDCVNLHLESEMLAQYKRELAQRGIPNSYHNMPQTAMGLWQCGCGSWQLIGTPCLNCKATSEGIAEAANLKTLTQHLVEYNEEQERIKAEEKKRIEEERIAHEKEEAKQKAALEASRKAEEEKAAIAKQKRKRIFCISGIITAVAIVGVIVVSRVIIPNGHYTEGEKAYASGKYLDAYQEYIDAGNFKDAPEKARQSACAQGESYLASKEYELSYEQYMLVGADSEAKQVASLLADSLYSTYDYGDAAHWYQIAGINEKAEEASIRWDSVSASENWLHYDTQEKPLELPDDIYLYCKKVTTGKYSSEKQYGIIRTGKSAWVSTHQDYTWVTFYPDQQLIIAGTDSMCTLIDVNKNTFVDISICSEISSVSENGIVCYRGENNRYGYIRKDGTDIATPQFSAAEPFSEGLAAVGVGTSSWGYGGAWGFIDESGKIVIDLEYTEVEPFDENGYAKVKMDAHKVKEGNLYVSYDEGWGLIDRSGKRIIEPNWYGIYYSNSWSSSPDYLDQGTIRVSKRYYTKYNNSYSKYGLFDTDGNMIFQPIYGHIGLESEGLRLVYVLAEGEANYPSVTAGWVDSNGKMKIDLIKLGIDAPSSGGEFKNGCAVLSYWKKNGWSRDICYLVINSTGQILWQGQDEDWNASQDGEGNIYIYHGDYRKKDSEQYFSTKDGVMIPTTKLATSWGKDTKQSENKDTVNLETPFYQQFATVYDFSEEAIARVSLNSKGPYGFVSSLEQIVVDPIYDDARDFQNGYAVVKVNGKWGCIDTNGRMIIDAQYMDISSISSYGTLFVQNDNEAYSLIDLNGNIILSDIMTVYSAEKENADILPIPGNSVFIKTKDENQWKLIDVSGVQVY